VSVRPCDSRMSNASRFGNRAVVFRLRCNNARTYLREQFALRGFR
jgi:hypothetical protein